MKRWEVAFRLVGMGWYVGACIFLGVAGGIWLDNRFNTRPVLVIVGLMLGVFVAFYGAYRMILPNFNNKNRNEGNS